MHEALLVFRSLGHGISDSFDPNLAYSHRIISRLVQIANVTVLLTGTNGEDHYQHCLKRCFGSRVKVVSLSHIMRQSSRSVEFPVADYRPFVDQSIQVYQHAQESDYTIIICDALYGPGFIPIRAKRTGLALQQTLLVSWLRNCRQFLADQRMEPPDDFDPFLMNEQRDFAEKYCCEYSDVVLAHTDAILEWVREREWKIDPERCVRLSILEPDTDLKTIFKTSALAWTSGEPHSQQAIDEPLVSVCIAHYNDAVNLGNLLRSIKGNDYRNFEVIVVDDGSTDSDSIEMFKSLASTYASNDWRFILKDHNEGPGPTRNAAVGHSKANLLIFMDSDNLATGTMISDLVKAMITAGTDCLTSASFLFEGDSTEPDPLRVVELWIPLGGDPNCGFHSNFFGDTNFCIKKSVFQALGGFSELRGTEDWDFLGRLVLAGFTLEVVPKGTYYYRIRSGSLHKVTVSTTARQIVRERLLKFSGSQHENLIHELLVQGISENERLRSSVWKLDRKVVQAALKLSEILSEKNRLMLQEMTEGVFENLKPLVSKAFQILGRVKPRDMGKRESLESHRSSAQESFKRCNFAVRELADAELQNERRRFDLPVGRPIFGLMGNLSEESRPLAFLKLAYWNQMSQDDSFFVMVGDGPLRNQVTNLASTYGLRNFKFISPVDNISQICPLLSGLVVTSRSDPGLREILEVLTYGVPVFATLCGPATGMLGTQGNWLVVKHEPEHKEFSHCFKNWKDNLGLYKQTARETAELFRGGLEG